MKTGHLVGKLVIIVAVFALAVVGAMASGGSECVEDCNDQLSEDLDTCRDERDARFAEIEAEFQACLEDAGADPRKQLQCRIQRIVSRQRAFANFFSCQIRAQADWRACVIDCQTSPSEPGTHGSGHSQSGRPGHGVRRIR